MAAFLVSIQMDVVPMKRHSMGVCSHTSAVPSSWEGYFLLGLRGLMVKTISTSNASSILKRCDMAMSSVWNKLSMAPGSSR